MGATEIRWFIRLEMGAPLLLIMPVINHGTLILKLLAAF